MPEQSCSWSPAENVTHNSIHKNGSPGDLLQSGLPLFLFLLFHKLFLIPPDPPAVGVDGVKRNVEEGSDLLRGVTGIGEFADGTELLLMGFEKAQELFMADMFHSRTGSRVVRRRLVMGILHKVFQVDVSACGVVHLPVLCAPFFLVGFPAGWLTAENRGACLPGTMHLPSRSRRLSSALLICY